VKKFSIEMKVERSRSRKLCSVVTIVQGLRSCTLATMKLRSRPVKT